MSQDNRMDISQHNSQAWDRQVADGNPWTQPVSPEVISKARAGDWSIVLTPTRAVPASWFPPLSGCEILLLAGGGGQQGPTLAAAGARVTVFDNSAAQLRQDRLVAEREGLEIETVQGDMTSLSQFSDSRFDLIVHPCSNCFVPDVNPVWREAFRVLKPGGALLSGLCNPVLFATDPALDKQGIAQFKYRIPYSDLTSISEAERKKYFPGQPLSFGHSLEDQLGGQLRAGFVLADLYEDGWSPDHGPIHEFLPCFLATRALKLQA